MGRRGRRGRRGPELVDVDGGSDRMGVIACRPAVSISTPPAHDSAGGLLLRVVAASCSSDPQVLHECIIHRHLGGLLRIVSV